jgi:L,D-transpeptidase catalytic domain
MDLHPTFLWRRFQLLKYVFTGIAAAFLATAAPSRAVARVPSAVAGAPSKTANTNVPGIAKRVAVRSAIDIDRAADAGVSSSVLNMALGAISCATASGAIQAPPTLTLIDYSLPSTEPRLWVFDLGTGELLFKELVAHGKNSGENIATRFSNEMDSRTSSLGLFVTGDSYVGSNGYSLRLEGLDVGFNDHALERAIVIHGAAYVDPQLAASQGRIGRSWGCPALRPSVASSVIDRIRRGGVVFSYYPDRDWLTQSRFLQGGCSAS